MKASSLRQGIIGSIKEKSAIKQEVYDGMLSQFTQLKQVLKKLVSEYNPELDRDDRLALEYIDRGQFVAQLKVAGDMLVFVMHSNTFQFDRDHEVWKQSYVIENPFRTYSGVVSIYNFLSDSFRYNRDDDPGYLIARVFVNRESCFFVEGKRQKSMGVDHFGSAQLGEAQWVKIVETSVKYAIDFDLLVPPYEEVKIISLAQMKEELESARMRTGKRLGFQYKSDDVK